MSQVRADRLTQRVVIYTIVCTRSIAELLLCIYMLQGYYRELTDCFASSRLSFIGLQVVLQMVFQQQRPISIAVICNFCSRATIFLWRSSNTESIIVLCCLSLNCCKQLQEGGALLQPIVLAVTLAVVLAVTLAVVLATVRLVVVVRLIERVEYPQLQCSYIERASIAG